MATFTHNDKRTVYFIQDRTPGVNESWIASGRGEVNLTGRDLSPSFVVNSFSYIGIMQEPNSGSYMAAYAADFTVSYTDDESYYDTQFVSSALVCGFGFGLTNTQFDTSNDYDHVQVFISYHPGVVSPPTPVIIDEKTVTFPAGFYGGNILESEAKELFVDWGDGVTETLALIRQVFDSDYVGEVQSTFSHTYSPDEDGNGSGKPIRYYVRDVMGRRSPWRRGHIGPHAEIELIFDEDEETLTVDTSKCYGRTSKIVKSELGGTFPIVADETYARNVTVLDGGEYIPDGNFYFAVEPGTVIGPHYDLQGVYGEYAASISASKSIVIAVNAAQIDALVLADGRVVTCAQDEKDVLTRVLFPTENGLKMLAENRVTNAKIGALAAKRDATLVRTLRRSTAIELETSGDGGKTWQ